jgi:hypothetical protein
MAECLLYKCEVPPKIKKEVTMFAGKCMNLEIVMLSERRQANNACFLL